MCSLTVAASILVLAGVAGAAQTPPPVREPIARGAAPAAQPSLRLLGVFDEDTGQPLAGVEVSDMLTGTSALTTVTGTVSLAFLSAGGSLVRVRKVGYAVQTLAVSQTDTAGITVILKRVAELPAVVTRDSARALSRRRCVGSRKGARHERRATSSTKRRFARKMAVRSGTSLLDARLGQR